MVTLGASTTTPYRLHRERRFCWVIQGETRRGNCRNRNRMQFNSLRAARNVYRRKPDHQPWCLSLSLELQTRWKWSYLLKVTKLTRDVLHVSWKLGNFSPARSSLLPPGVQPRHRHQVASHHRAASLERETKRFIFSWSFMSANIAVDDADGGEPVPTWKAQVSLSLQSVWNIFANNWTQIIV